MPDLRLLQDEIIQCQVLDSDCLQFLSLLKLKENGSNFSKSGMLTLSPVHGCLGGYCFLCLCLSKHLPRFWQLSRCILTAEEFGSFISVPHLWKELLQNNLVKLSVLFLRLQIWDRSTSSPLRIYHSSQFCMFHLASVCHLMAQQLATAALLPLDISGNAYTCVRQFLPIQMLCSGCLCGHQSRDSCSSSARKLSCFMPIALPRRAWKDAGPCIAHPHVLFSPKIRFL